MASLEDLDRVLIVGAQGVGSPMGGHVVVDHRGPRLDYIVLGLPIACFCIYGHHWNVVPKPQSLGLSLNFAAPQ
jgi:hypothetical protein